MKVHMEKVEHKHTPLILNFPRCASTRSVSQWARSQAHSSVQRIVMGTESVIARDTVTVTRGTVGLLVTRGAMVGVWTVGLSLILMEVR